MTITYRDATIGDAAALLEVFSESFIDTFGHLYRPADLNAFMAENTDGKWRGCLADADYATRIAEMDGEIVGFAELAPRKLPYDGPEPTLEIRRFYLLKRAHGTGVADELMRWVLEEAARRGAKELLLSVYVDNHRARRFYERYGFHEVGRFDFMVGSHADEDLILRHVILQGSA